MLDLAKYPRLYVTDALKTGKTITLEKPQAHYLKNVMRMQPGEKLRLFNGRDGEYIAEIFALDKKQAALRLLEQSRPQGPPRKTIHLIFSPLKKDRMDFLVEKAVELGATDLHPVLMERTNIRKLNEERLQAQIIEAAEQCERIDVPVLHPLKSLLDVTAAWPEDVPVFWCHERGDAPHLKSMPGEKSAFLIGPAGGFAPAEISFLERQKKIRAVSLGPDILRAETAALYCLALN